MPLYIVGKKSKKAQGPRYDPHGDTFRVQVNLQTGTAQREASGHMVVTGHVLQNSEEPIYHLSLIHYCNLIYKLRERLIRRTIVRSVSIIVPWDKITQ